MSQSMTDERTVRGGNFVFFGGTHGMGRAAATALAQRGASILLVARDAEVGKTVATQLRAAGATAADFLSGDLSTIGGIKAVADGVRAWRPELHGVMHTAMAAFSGKKLTADGLEFAFALQYLARAMLNRLLVDALSASGDGRIVHIAGNVPGFIQPDLDDLQFERRKWGFFKSVLGTHVLGFLHIQEATRRWQGLPVSLTAACVESVKTKAMLDPQMPLVMRLMGKFGTTPELAARNAIRVLTAQDVSAARGAILRSSKRYAPEPLALDPARAARLWTLTSELAAQKNVTLPDDVERRASIGMASAGGRQ